MKEEEEEDASMVWRAPSFLISIYPLACVLSLRCVAAGVDGGGGWVGQEAVFRFHDGVATLDEELLDLVLARVELRLDLRRLVGQDGAGNDAAGHSARAAQSGARRNEHVRHVLVLAQQRQMQKDGKRLSVGGKDDQLGDT